MKGTYKIKKKEDPRSQAPRANGGGPAKLGEPEIPLWRKSKKNIGGEWAKRGEPRERPRSQTPGKIEEAKVEIDERNREGGAKAWTP